MEEGAIARRVEGGPRVTTPASKTVALPENEHWWRTFANALPAAIYMTDAQGRITFYNEAAAELWGCHPEIGKSEWCGSWRLFWPDGTPLPHDACPMAVALKENRGARGGSDCRAAG